MTPQITVVTVCYNAEHEIEKTIKSVIGQTYKNIEYIIVDGKSSDKTMSIVSQYEQHISLSVSEPDKGVYDAMNKAIKKANGEWIIFMNAGDVFYDNTVLEDVALNMSNEYSVVFGDIIVHRFECCVRCLSSHAYMNPNLLDMGFNHQACFVKTEIAKQLLFNLRYKLAADYDMMRRIHLLGGKFHKVDRIISVYDINGLSSNNRLLHYKERLISTYSNKFKIFVYYYCYRIKKIAELILEKLFPDFMYNLEKNVFLKNNQLM